jgi:hypothetical protein
MTLIAAALTNSTTYADVRWAWDWSPLATGVLWAVAIAWVVSVYANEQRFASRRVRAALAALRLSAVAILLAMLAQPTLERRRVAPPRIVLAIDRSQSMETRDVPAAELDDASGATANVTRTEAWKNIIADAAHPLVDTLRERYDVDLIRFASKVERVSFDSRKTAAEAVASLINGEKARDAQESRVGEAIDFAARQLEGPRPAAVVVITDGINTAGRSLADAAARARTVGTPVFAIALGSDRPRPDVLLEDVLVEEVVFPGDRLQLEATVRATGFNGASARVILKKSESESDQAVAESPVVLPADGRPQTVRLALRPTEPGPLPLAVEVEAQAGEDDVSNNKADVTIDVRKEPIRALLVDSTPSFEFRALKSLLERDPAIKLQVHLQDADAEYASVDAAAVRNFPATEAELLKYDVVLMSDVDPQLVPRSAWANLHKFVSEEGGGLALIAGPRFMPQALADIEAMRTLLPIEAPLGHALRTDASMDVVAIRPTRLGVREPSLQIGETMEQSAAVWKELPPVNWTLKDLRMKPGAQMLAEGISLKGPDSPPAPAILRQYVGAGEVLMHATDETWRWRWRSDDRYFARYWGQVVRRLARGRALRGGGSLATNRAEYAIGEPVLLRARLRSGDSPSENEATVELEGASSTTQRIRLQRKAGYGNVFETTLRGLAADRYTARLTTSGDRPAVLSTEFVVQAPPGELAHLAVNAEGLREVAKTTGGKYYTAKTASRLLDDLPKADPTLIEQLPDKPLWNSPWLLSALCAALGSEWLLRRRTGML